MKYRVRRHQQCHPDYRPRPAGRRPLRWLTPSSAQVFATTSWFQLANQSYPRIGRFITASDDDSRRRVVVLGEKARADLKLPDDPLGTFIQIGSEWFKVVGVMEARGELFGQSQDNYVVVPFQTGWALAGAYNQPDMAMIVTVDDLDAVDDVKSRITAMLRRAHKIGAADPDDFKVESSQSLTETSRARVRHDHPGHLRGGRDLTAGGRRRNHEHHARVGHRTNARDRHREGAGRAAQLHPHAVPDPAMVLAVIGGIIGVGSAGCRRAGGQDYSALPSAGGAVVGGRRRDGIFCARRQVVWDPARARAANLAPIDALRHE